MSSSSKPITILQILPSLITGGVERTTVDIAAGIVAAGGRALVASAGGPMVHELTRVGAQHITLPLATKNPWHIWRNSLLLKRLILQERVDIAHARSRAPAWSARQAAQQANCAFVTTFHGIYNHDTRLKRWYNAIMTRGDLVIANSDFTRRHIIDTYQIDPERIRTIVRGIDLALFDPRNIKQERLISLARSWYLPDGDPLIMLPGRLARWKGHLALLPALKILAEIHKQPFHCVLVGEASQASRYHGELEQAIIQMGLAGMVRLVGACRDMPAAYMLASVVVSASTKPEAFGRVAAEASAMGRLTIATDHGGARETILPGTTGWLVPPNDANALAHALADALTITPERHAQIATQARTHIAAHFSKTSMIEATLAVYNSLLNP